MQRTEIKKIKAKQLTNWKNRKNQEIKSGNHALHRVEIKQQ